MSKALAFIAGLGTGYMQGEDKKRREKVEDERLARERETYEAGKAERQRQGAMRQAILEAAAPVKVETGNIPAIDDEGIDPPTPAAPARIGARSFASRADAEAEATKANTPEARRSRIIDAMTAHGDVMGADQLRTSGLQAKAAQIKIDAATRDEANQTFDQGIRTALQTGGPQALAQFMSDSHADGQGGKQKFQAVVAPDGKSWQMAMVGEDGSLSPIGQRFSNDEAGYATAGFMLSRAVPDAQKVEHLRRLAEDARRGEHDAAVLKQGDRRISLAEKEAADNARYRSEQLKIERERLAALQAKTKPGGPIQLDLKDIRDFEGDLSGYIKDQYPLKEGATPEERAALQAEATKVRSLGTSLFRLNAQAGQPTTAGQIMQAMQAAQQPGFKPVVARVNGIPHHAVVVDGQTVLISQPLQERAAQAGPPAAAAGAAPAAAAAPSVRDQGFTPSSVPAAGNFQAAPAPVRAAPARVSPAAVDPKVAAQMQPYNDAVQKASESLRAAAASGDPTAISFYTTRVEQARAARKKAAVPLFGQAQAAEYIASLPY